MNLSVRLRSAAIASCLLTLCACGIGNVGNVVASGGSKSALDTNTTALIPHAPPTPTATASATPIYALRGRFSPGDTNVLAPQIMTWGHSSIVARVTHTTQITVSLSNIQGSGAYSLSATNEAVSGSAPVTATFDPSVSVGSLTGLDPEATYTVTFLKHVEAMYASATFGGFALDANGGYLTAPEAPTRRLEIIGDSISCGYGDLGASGSCPALASNEESEDAYGPVAGATLGADVHVVAWSGKGMYENYGGGTTETMPEIWQRSVATDGNTAWNTSSWIPQVVVINLGTNDFTNTVDQTSFVQTYTRFLATLRAAYPKAAIVASIGPMLQGTNLTTCVSDMQQAITARQGAGDNAVYLLEYAVEDTNTGAGCAYHPNIGTQASMASALVAKINTVVQW